MPFFAKSFYLFKNLLKNPIVTHNIIRNYASNLVKPAIKDIDLNKINIKHTLKNYKVKRPKIKYVDAQKQNNIVKAFATAEEYNLEKLWELFSKDELYVSDINTDDMPNVLYVHAKHNTNQNHSIFFFRDGVTVFWNPKDMEVRHIMENVKACSSNLYDQSIVEEECDSLDFTYHDNGTKFHDGKIYLQNKDLNVLELYTFANSLSQSVKLAIWEGYLDKYAEVIERLVDDLKSDHKIKISEKDVLQKAGELYALRHLINLSSDLLDSPDFYWDRDSLETLYRRACTYLNIPRRTRVMNEKLNHCCDIINLLKTSLNDKHHIRLEWMIIILILVEVFLGLMTTYKIYEPNIFPAIKADSPKDEYIYTDQGLTLPLQSSSYR